ncbi:hypothetical protein [Flavobacterium sp.]|uniref:hypothetical protein n=1 Tax=Flavobacterium sp. TaxID=239 RepID=UPI003F69D42C
MYKSTRFICFSILILWLGCRDASDDIISSINAIQDLDSAYLILEQNPTNEVGYVFTTKLKKYCQSNLDSNYTNKYINKLFDLSVTLNNACFKNYAEQCKTLQQFVIGNIEESRRWTQQMLISTAENSDVDALDVYHLAGISYYSPPVDVDSTLKFWKLGFQRAVEDNDSYRIYFFANNLGAVFFELDMFEISRQFFLKALTQAKINNTVSPVLLNNVLNSITNTNDFSSARDFFNQHQANFNVNPRIFQNQSVYLNSILMNQKLENNRIADSLIRAFPIDSIHPSFKAKYISLHLRQFLNSGDTFFINSNIQEHAKDCGIGLLDHTTDNLGKLKSSELTFIWEIIESDVVEKLKNIENDQSHAKYLLNAIDILLDKYKDENNAVYNKYLLEYGRVSRLANMSVLDMNHYITEVRRVEDLFDKLIVRNKEIKLQNKNVQLLTLSLFLLLGILGISFFFYRKKIKFRKQKELMLLKEKDLLIRQNTLNDRVVEFSKELIQFNKKVKTELDKINLDANNTDFLRKFRSDLLGFISIDLKQNPKIADLAFDNLTEDKISNKDNSEELNKTEKRVFTLLNEGFKPNEVSGMLGVTTQYVYNIKTKLKRMGIPLE